MNVLHLFLFEEGVSIYRSHVAILFPFILVSKKYIINSCQSGQNPYSNPQKISYAIRKNLYQTEQTSWILNQNPNQLYTYPAKIYKNISQSNILKVIKNVIKGLENPPKPQKTFNSASYHWFCILETPPSDVSLYFVPSTLSTSSIMHMGPTSHFFLTFLLIFKALKACYALQVTSYKSAPKFILVFDYWISSELFHVSLIHLPGYLQGWIEHYSPMIRAIRVTNFPLLRFLKFVSYPWIIWQ